MWQNFSGRVHLLCIPCFNCLCSVLTMSLVHKKNLISQFLKSKMADRSEMARNAIQSEFRTSKMTESSHFVKKFKKKKSCVSIWNGQRYEWFEQCSNRLLADYNLVSMYIYIQRAMLGTREYTLCSPFRANAHNSSYYYFWVTVGIAFEYVRNY